MHTAIVFGAPLNIGGLGVQAAKALHTITLASTRVSAFGPSSANELAFGRQVSWHAAPSPASSWRTRYTSLRWEQGKLQFENDVRVGKWAAKRLRQVRPDLLYVFTQVGLESLRLARKSGIPSILESPNGHICGFRKVYVEEALRWCHAKYRGHPTELMVGRVEEEYKLADRIRVSSHWAKSSLVSWGIAADKINVHQPSVDLTRYKPPEHYRPTKGPLRILFVGSLDLRKGFIYLLEALRLLEQTRYSVELLGATGDRCCARLFARYRQGLNVNSAPGDAVPAYHRNELFVLPSLEDGWGFAAAEAMASGLPAIVTDACGSAELVEEGLSGWVIPPRAVYQLAEVFELACKSRDNLNQMGADARRSVEKRTGPQADQDVANWLSQVAAPAW